MKLYHLKTQQSAFILPSILIMMTVVAIVAFATMNLTRTSNLAASKQSYLQMAHIASKAAMDFAKEEYELDSNYNGTPEFDLVSNGYYRLAIKVDVLSTSGNTKYIQAFGYVYLPEISTTASFVRDIKGGIIREGISVGNPLDFDPLVWLDASVSDSLISSSASSGNQTITSVYGSAAASVVEERGSDATGTPGTLVFGNDDLDMSWGGNDKGNQIIGLRFSGVNIPPGATIDNAYIQFTTDQTRKAGAIGFDIEGIASDNAPTWSGSSAVSGAIKTTASTSWDPVDWNVVGSAGPNERTSDLSAIVQEIVDRSGWASGNDMAFSITKTSGGSGKARRTAEKGLNSDDPQLYVEWTTSGSETVAGNGDSVTRWEDQSGNGNHANIQFGTAPIRRDTQLNGNPIVEFASNGTLMSSLPSTSASAMTAFVVMRPGASSDTDARYLTAMNSTESTDTTVSNGMVSLKRFGSSNDLENYHNSNRGESLSGAIDNQYAIYTSRIVGSPNWVERLLKNGVDNYTNTITNVNYTVDQIFFGGGRNSTSGAFYADADIAEIIFYDSELSNCEIEEVEAYLGLKWGITVTAGKC